MEISDIVKDSFKYPFSDKKQFGLIFVVFLLVGIIVGCGLLSLRYLAMFRSVNNVFGILVVIGLIVYFAFFVWVLGYQLDIVKISCERGEEIPLFNPLKNIKNGLKSLLIVLIFYIICAVTYAIVFLVSFPLLSTGNYIAAIICVVFVLIFAVLLYLFSFIFMISICRLSYLESIDEAADIKECWRELRTVGIRNMFIVVVIISIVAVFISIIAAFVSGVMSAVVPSDAAVVIAPVISFALGSYIVLFTSRSLGLLYSNVVYDF